MSQPLILVETTVFRPTAPFKGEPNGLRAANMHRLLDEAARLGARIEPEDRIFDYEDWSEEVGRRLAAMKAAARLDLSIVGPNDLATMSNGVVLDLRGPMLKFGGPRGFGVSDPVVLVMADDPPVYATSAAFAARAGRTIRICRNDDEADVGSYPSLKETLRELGEQGHASVMWKMATGAAKAYPVAEISTSTPIEEDVAWATVHMGGLSMLQGVRRMLKETRIFVIDGEVVCGAACIETHTPDDRTRIPVVDGVTTTFELQRGSGAFVSNDRETARRMADFACQCASDFQAEGLFDYSLDLFVDGDTGEIGVIELNGVNASGLYANDVDAIFLALAETLARRATLVPTAVASPALG